jgi:hypothetical protein
LHEMLDHCIESSKRPMCIFVDGLDEFRAKQTEQLGLAVFLQRLASFELVKVCFASRPHPVLQQKFGSGVFLEMQEWNKPGLQQFVSHTLGDMDLGPEEMRHLAGLVADMAEGVFLWAKFALDNLVDLWSQQKLDFTSLLLRLAQLPTEVEDLWDEIREKLTPNQKREANVLLQIVCFAAKPLTLVEFFDAWQYQDVIPTPLWVAGDYLKAKLPAMREAIAMLSCGLLEVGPDPNGGERVLLVHKSVQRYLDTRGWWLSCKDDTSPEQLWLRICIKSLDAATCATDRTLCYQNSRQHRDSNAVCKAHGCYNQLPDRKFPTKLLKELHQLTIGSSRKTTFLKRGYALSPFLAYTLHWLPYFAWKLERTRKLSCFPLTNPIMCPETIYLCAYVKHTSCTSCLSAATDATGLWTPISFHGTEFPLSAFFHHKIRRRATLGHYLNDHSTDLLISAEGPLGSALPWRTQENIDFTFTEGNHDDTTKVMILMGFERDAALQGTMLQQPLLGSKPRAYKIAVVGSRSVGTGPFISNTPKSLRHSCNDFQKLIEV